jgi:pyruvate carboxylase
MSPREIHWNIKGKDIAIRIEEAKGSGTFRIDDQLISFRLIDRNTLEIDGRRLRFYAIREANTQTVWINGHIYHLTRSGKSSLVELAAARAGGEITALMPGKLLRLEVAVGETVSEKQTVAIMESMKMETALRAPKAGRIAEIRRQPGEAVEMGEVIIVIKE